MRKITKVELLRDKIDASQVDCPTKAETSGTVTTVVPLGCICTTCCNLVNWQ